MWKRGLHVSAKSSFSCRPLAPEMDVILGIEVRQLLLFSTRLLLVLFTVC